MERVRNIPASLANNACPDIVRSQRNNHRVRTGTHSYNMVFLLVGIAMFTSSFDVFLNLDFGGFNLRFSQLALVPVICVYVCCSLRGIRGNAPRGGVLLVLWVGLLGVFMFRSPSLLNGLGYEAWLCLDALTVFSLVYFARSCGDIRWMLKAYLASFVFMSIVGIVQFCLYLVGIDFYVAQIYKEGIARANGFCFEPSYYATYMLMGFVMFSYLWEKQDTTLLSMKRLRIGLVLTAIAMILSTSRMGLLMMMFWIVFRIVVNAVRFMFGKKRVSASRLALGLIACVAILGIVVYLSDTSGYFWRGFGFDGTSSHSSAPRINALMQSIEAFLEDPWCGYGLGGVDPLLAERLGETYVVGDNGNASSLIGEIAISGGVFGLLLFVLFLCCIIFGKLNSSEFPFYLMQRASIWALVFEFAILCMNQNILRVYFWIHVAMVCVSWIKISQLDQSPHGPGMT